MRNGFTLIELLVVVLIIGILAGIALPQYTQSVYKSRFTQLVILGKAIADAQERYYLSEGKYTNDLTALDIDIPTGNFTLGPDVRADGHAALNVIATNMKMGYIVYFNKHSLAALAGVRQCRVYEDANKWRQTCLSMGGTKYGACPAAEGGYCHIYAMP